MRRSVLLLASVALAAGAVPFGAHANPPSCYPLPSCQGDYLTVSPGNGVPPQSVPVYPVYEATKGMNIAILGDISNKAAVFGPADTTVRWGGWLYFQNLTTSSGRFFVTDADCLDPDTGALIGVCKFSVEIHPHAVGNNADHLVIDTTKFARGATYRFMILNHPEAQGTFTTA